MISPQKLRALAVGGFVALGACGGHASNDTPRPAAQPPTGWRSFGDTRLGFSIAYPKGWHVDQEHVYPPPVNDTRLAGVAFIIPESLSAHTNLSTDSYIAVEAAPGSAPCDARAFVETVESEHTEMHGGFRWTVATMSDAGAGNFYDVTVYALGDSHPCLGIRYFIHSTNIGAYTPGTVRQFDRASLVKMFDRIRSTVALAQRDTKP